MSIEKEACKQVKNPNNPQCDFSKSVKEVCNPIDYNAIISAQQKVIDKQQKDITELDFINRALMHERDIGISEKRKDYLRRLIAGVRLEIEKDSKTIKAKNEAGMDVTIGRWLDASLLCRVVEMEVLEAIKGE